MYAVDKRVISTNTLKHFFLLQNNENREQNKLVNMADWNYLINVINGHVYIWPMFSEPSYAYA